MERHQTVQPSAPVNNTDAAHGPVPRFLSVVAGIIGVIMALGLLLMGPAGAQDTPTTPPTTAELGSSGTGISILEATVQTQATQESVNAIVSSGKTPTQTTTLAPTPPAPDAEILPSSVPSPLGPQLDQSSQTGMAVGFAILLVAMPVVTVGAVMWLRTPSANHR